MKQNKNKLFNLIKWGDLLKEIEKQTAFIGIGLLSWIHLK